EWRGEQECFQIGRADSHRCNILPLRVAASSQTIFPARAFAGIFQRMGRSEGTRMRYASVLVAVLVATAALFSLSAQAGERYLVTPEEIGIGPPPARYTWLPL